MRGDFELVASERVLAELVETFARPKLVRRVSPEDAVAFVELLSGAAILAGDPINPPSRSNDPDDDYLVALAETAGAVLVSGDGDLLKLAPELPILSPRQFLTQMLEA